MTNRRRMTKVCLLTAMIGLTTAMGTTCAGTVDITAAIALNGTYLLNVTSADAGALLPTGTMGNVVIANGLMTTFLNQAVTNPQNPTINGTNFIWKATLPAPGNPLISAEVTLNVTNQGGGTLTGTTFFTILGVATAPSQCTMQRQ